MTDTSADDPRIRIFYNTNVEMSRGKLAAHAAHAALTAAGVHPGVPIVVLGGKPRDIEKMATVMHDAGKTELEPGTLTTGTDYVFASRRGREEAIDRLVELIGLTDNGHINDELRAIVDLLGGK